ncbi:RNA polymerase sigma factor [Aceticella autotrophica]|uniref:RNA polymerase sigma factor n=1 Tax=Aceticella autotrophica TaxID=2755338 RepID=A0A975GAF1_9THEO|nr:RNA polymerase sigma factor [Aceticella autotrophica]QSZ27116.1 RNA polymerase sigma factor [Aceticella autotrophica]
MVESFLEFYEKNFDDVYRYVYFKIGNKWDTDDIVSEIFKKAYEKYKSIKSNPRSWLFSIAKNTITDHYRKNKNVTLEDNISYFSYHDIFENKFEKEAEIDCLKKSIYSLPKEEIEIINLKYFAGMTHREISQIIQKTEDAVKMKVFRIIQKLKNLVIKCLEG